MKLFNPLTIHTAILATRSKELLVQAKSSTKKIDQKTEHERIVEMDQSLIEHMQNSCISESANSSLGLDALNYSFLKIPQQSSKDKKDKEPIGNYNFSRNTPAFSLSPKSDSLETIQLLTNNFDKANDLYNAGKAAHLNKNSDNALKFFLDARDKYKAILAESIDGKAKEKIEKRLANLKNPDGKYCTNKLKN